MARDQEKPAGGVSWSVEATLLGYCCQKCGKTIEYEERVVYFQTQSCRSCQELEEQPS